MKKYKLSQNQVSSKLATETVILNHKAGTYYNLNEVGSFIWEKLTEGTQSFEELLAAMLNEYEIDEETCRNDLKEILQQLVDEKLVENI